ncbi:uncharacterized protein LOC121773778 isoform X1 [Salvia splendens]|uniref:uncharacterized protein LOC121773778 isoform X1 n=1 Tax=Salvia splendens TaxID=180675 RepID=UPI001C27F28D|nr:uncharacterized protein LOC121773778 isoform X1 [Salvia splendens]
MKMADDDGVEGAGYWLPSEFLTDDDFVTNKENSDSKRFPTDFPCNFQIQSNNGSQYDAVGDLALAAAEVAKQKLNPSPPPEVCRNTSIAKTGSLFPPQFENIGPMAGRGGGGMGHDTWAPNRGRVAHGGGAAAAAKKACAGTGVFLPRRYDTTAVNSHSAAAPRRSLAYPFQGREAAQIHTKPLLSHFVENETQPLPPPKISRGFASDHYSAVARRRDLVVLLLQQRSQRLQSPVAEGSRIIGCDRGRLPVEWTY